MSEDVRIFSPRTDLGIRRLLPEWAKIIARTDLTRDAVSGLRLAAITLPLSIWVAVVSGAPPEMGIVTAAVGSAVCVFFGGTRVALSAPGLTSAMLVTRVYSEHGPAAAGAVVVFCGLLQVITGALGIGRFVRLVPLSVVRGVVFGLGVLMILQHLPALIGGSFDVELPILERLDRIGAHLPTANVYTLAIAGVTAICAIGLPRLSRNLPGALIGIVVCAAAVAAFALDVPAVDAGRLPSLVVPAPPSREIAQLVGVAFELWLTTTLGTLVSVGAVERIDRSHVDPDQEMIGTGLASVALGFLGALPATTFLPAAFAGARERSRRRAALVQAVVVLAIGLAVWPLLSFVPVAALTGIVLATALPLLDPRPLWDLAKIARFELAVALVTAIGVGLLGLSEGLETGLALAFLIATFRIARTRAIVHPGEGSEPHHVAFSGPITFLASLELERLRARIADLDAAVGLVIDLRSVVSMDASGVEGIASIVENVRDRGGRAALLGPNAACRERLIAAARPSDVESLIAPTARDLERILDKPVAVLGRQNLLFGLTRFREEVREHYDSLFEHLADGQHPHTMLITCADSRISPSHLMGAHPGDVFIVRCIGALVPPAGADPMPQEGAALEYGIGVLGIKQVVVCGHSKCGAIGALKKGSVPAELPSLCAWAEHAGEIAGDLSSFADVDEAVRGVTVRQLEHLKTYPLVRERLEKGELHIHAWFYDLGKVELYEWSEDKKEFVAIGASSD